jgi:hypothetical protein
MKQVEDKGNRKKEPEPSPSKRFPPRRLNAVSMTIKNGENKKTTGIDQPGVS